MKLQWLFTKTLQIVTLLGVILLATPALAARLQFVQFDRDRNQLEFRTEGAVQPQAQLIADPTRLVIDLPGTTVDLSATNQPVNGVIRSVRVAQFNPQTTRIVVELAPGYSMDPQQIKFRGLSPSQWVVQLPTPQRIATTPTPTPDVASTNPASAPANAATGIQAVNATPDGFLVKTVGAAPQVRVQRSTDRRMINFDFLNTLPVPNLAEREILINSSLIERLVVLETPSNPPSTRLALTVSPDSPDWVVVPSRAQGVILLPRSGNVQVKPTTPTAQTPPNAPQPSIATIQSVELNTNTNQLLIHADRSFGYEGGWRNGQYRLAISPARLASNVRGPQLVPGGPLFRVRLIQEDAQTVAILVSPARGVRVDQLNAISPQLLALQFQRLAPVLTPPSTPPTTPPIMPPPVGLPPNQIPGQIPGQVPIGRVVVVIDPGHGGPDPGAIGIGGLQEKEVVLPISFQVASILQQRGVQVVMTRQDDRDLDLEPRVQIAEQVNATIFVSIHANALSLSRPDVNGVETYYFSSGDRLAQSIHRSILQSLNVRDRGVRQARFYVLRRTSMPAVLVEVGFVTGSEDAARLGTNAYRSQMATAIANGILQYLSQNGFAR